MKNDEYFMNEALDEAKKALERGDWPIGCVIVRKQKVVSRGRNRIYSSGRKLAHAEMSAIEKISKDLIKNRGEYTLYTTIEPCTMCLGAALLHHIRKIVFGAKDSAGSSHFVNDLPKIFKEAQYKMEIEGGILSDECYKIFRQGKPTKKLIKDKLILEEYK